MTYRTPLHNRLACVLITLATLLFTVGCEIIDPEEELPTFVHIDSFQFVPQPHTGTSSHKITTVWAYMDHIPLGVFNLPATIPVLFQQAGTLQLEPGVSFSGLKNVLLPYPYYAGDTIHFVPKQGEVIHVSPQTTYISTDFIDFVIEDFETGNSFVNLSGDTLARSNQPEHVFEGSYGGFIQTDTMISSENVLSEPFNANSGSKAFVELNYKCTLDFEIGVQIMSPTGDYTYYLYGFRPSSEWNKVYVNLQDAINSYPNSTYRVVVRLINVGKTGGFAVFDNFKVLTLK